MDRLQKVRQELILTRQLEFPAEIRADESHPVESSKTVERIHGMKKVLKKLREIEKRRSKDKRFSKGGLNAL